MRIVFEVEGTPLVACSTRHHGGYVTEVTQRPIWKGMPVDILVVTNPTEDEAIYLEGNLDSIRSMCNNILEQINDLEKDVKEEFDAYQARSVQCKLCRCWYDSKEIEGHSDGKGAVCAGFPKDVTC